MCGGLQLVVEWLAHAQSKRIFFLRGKNIGQSVFYTCEARIFMIDSTQVADMNYIIKAHAFLKVMKIFRDNMYGAMVLFGFLNPFKMRPSLWHNENPRSVEYLGKMKETLGEMIQLESLNSWWKTNSIVVYNRIQRTRVSEYEVLSKVWGLLVSEFEVLILSVTEPVSEFKVIELKHRQGIEHPSKNRTDVKFKRAWSIRVHY